MYNDLFELNGYQMADAFRKKAQKLPKQEKARALQARAD